LTENAKVIGHIQTVLYGRRRTDAAACESERDVRRVLEDTMQRRPLEGEVLPDGVPGTCRVKRALNDPGLVSLIVAVTRDASEFRKCIESIRNKTSYGDIEIIVPYCDRAVDKSLRRFFRSAGVKGIKCEHSANISQLMNAGAEIAKGKYLLFARDIDVITEGWIESLLEHAQRGEIGVVGARLLDAQQRIQHAGYFLVDSGCGVRNSFSSAPHDDPGYFGLAGVARECIAVSSAALMVRRDVFDELGGFDERLDGVQRDVDFCLQARQHGYRTITTPYAVVAQCPAESRTDTEETKSPIYWDRWRHVHEKGDPYYNPNLTQRRGDYSINEEPVLLTQASSPIIEPEAIAKILVIKLDHLGDLVLTLPAL